MSECLFRIQVTFMIMEEYLFRFKNVCDSVGEVKTFSHMHPVARFGAEMLCPAVSKSSVISLMLSSSPNPNPSEFRWLKVLSSTSFSLISLNVISIRIQFSPDLIIL